MKEVNGCLGLDEELDNAGKEGTRFKRIRNYPRMVWDGKGDEGFNAEEEKMHLEARKFLDVVG